MTSAARRVSLQQILDEHDGHARVANALRDNLGDGYLLAHSPVCRRLRANVLALGWELSNRDEHGSLGWPLASLRAMLAKRQLPYKDNVRALRRELKEATGHLTLDDLLTVVPTGNRLAHESAHAIAFQSLFGGRAKDLEFTPGLSRRTRRDRILRSHLCESFANACDMYAQIEPVRGAGELFVTCGLYRRLAPDSSQAWRRLRDAWGDADTMALSIVAFLHANFLYKRTRAAHRRRALALLGLRAGRGSVLEQAVAKMFERALELNPQFRLQTTAVYFRHMGLKLDLFRALDFDFMELLEQDAPLVAKIRGLAAVAERV